MENTTAVYLTPEEALAFVQFQKHFTFIQLLESLGVFGIKSGSVEVHFDKLGQIGSVDIHQHYKQL